MSAFPEDAVDIASPELWLENFSEKSEEGEISTGSEYEIEPEEQFQRVESRKEKRERKKAQKHKEEKKKRREKFRPVVQIFHQNRKKVRTSNPPPFEPSTRHELTPARDCRIKKKSQTRIFFDGIIIPENYMGKVFPSEHLRASNVSTGVFPFNILGKEKEKGFWLDFTNRSPNDIILRSDRPCAYLCLTKLESFFVQHEEMYTEEQRQTLSFGQKTGKN